MSYHLDVPKGYEKYKRKKLKKSKAREEFEKKTEYKTRFYIV